MQLLSGGRSLWIYSVIFTAAHLWGRLSSSSSSSSSSFMTSSPTLLAPSLSIHWRSRDSVVLTCTVQQGHQGVLFMLYRVREMVDSQELQSGADEVQFRVDLKEESLDQLFCCLYKDQGGRYSAFSPYLRLDGLREAVPSPSTPASAPPVLTVVPSSGVVKCGDVLSFSCSLPAPLPQSGSPSGPVPDRTVEPSNFLLLRTTEPTGAASAVLLPQASQASGPGAQAGVFTVGPVRGGDDGEYTCIYQFSARRQLVNSSVSNRIQVTVKDKLPLPTLLLHQRTDVWHLVCSGSPAYPAAVFALYPAEAEHPLYTQRAKVTQHQVTFPVPVQDSAVASYQCEYSVLLGTKWSHSERSKPASVTTGHDSPSSDVSPVDWPLVLGSFSAVVLFLCSVLLVAVVTHRKVKAAAEKKKSRQEAKFWTQVHSKEHVVDLTLRRSSFTSQDWSRGQSGSTSRSPLWNHHSTFSSPDQ